MAKKAPLDTTIEVVTPENIAFKYSLAGPFRRLPAFLIDFFIRAAIFLGLVIIASILGISAAGIFGGTVVPAMLVAAALVLFFVLSWFYGVFFETYFNGRTPGKWACGLRVISDDGHPISGMQALLRNLLRVADLLPPAVFASFDPENAIASIPIATGIVGLITMIMTKRLQRLGDIAAGTIVVIDERNWTLPISRVDDARVPALASFVPADYRVSPTMAKALASYAERRAYLSPGRRREIAKHLAGPLLERFEFRSDIDTDLLLYALYYRTFLADQSTEAVDLGPLAAFSPLARDANVQQMIAAPESQPQMTPSPTFQQMPQPASPAAETSWPSATNQQQSTVQPSWPNEEQR